MMAYAVLAIVFYNNDGWFQFISLSMISDDINITSTISQQQLYQNLKKHNSRDKVVKYLYLNVIGVVTN